MNIDKELFQIHMKNEGESRLIQEQYKKYIRANDCYTNIWRLFTPLLVRKKDDYRVAFGYIDTYMSDGQELLVRHAFLLNKNNEVVDPTIATIEGENHRRYYVLVTFDTQEYLEVMSSVCNTDIVRYAPYEQLNVKFVKWCCERQIPCVG